MIPSIRELELEEKVARLLQRVHELESKQGPITIDEAALWYYTEANCALMCQVEAENTLPNRIRAVASIMRNLGREMATHTHSEVRQHGTEMLRAAGIAESWAPGIEEDLSPTGEPPTHEKE